MSLITPSPRSRLRQAYTLIEVLAASAIIAVAVGAAASMTASVSLQEEHARRVAIVRNLQENAARLWQLGLRPDQIRAIMPEDNANLNLALFEPPVIIELGNATLGATPAQVTVETALCRASVNIGPTSILKQQGSTFDMMLCRPSIR